MFLIEVMRWAAMLAIMPTICRVVNYANACPLSPLMHVVLLQWLD